MSSRCFWWTNIAQNARYLSSSVALSAAKNHYDSLGITPKATQVDIKAAYYKLSMLYHPDKNKGSEAATKFRDITEAYEVLGNLRIRKLYDKGVFHSGMAVRPREDDDPTITFYRSRDTRSKPPPPTGRTPIYDFDEWSRSHYGALFAKDMEHRRRMKFQEIRVERDKQDVKSERVFIAMAALLFMCVYLSMTSRNVTDDVTYTSFNDNIIPTRVNKVE